MMLTLLAPLVLLQTPAKVAPRPPQTPPRDKRYRWGNSNRATVVVNGKAIILPAIIRDNRIQVPMRAIFEPLGANLMWYPENRKVVAMARGKTISLVVDDNFANTPEPVVLDYPPRMVKGSVYVPLRFVSQSLGAKVRFDNKRKIAYVDLPMEAR